MADLKGGSTVAGYPIFHLGNMGSGSGLDADTVDSKHSTDILLRDGSQAMTAGNLTLYQDPSSAMHAVTKQYIDRKIGYVQMNTLHSSDSMYKYPKGTSLYKWNNGLSSNDFPWTAGVVYSWIPGDNSTTDNTGNVYGGSSMQIIYNEAGVGIKKRIGNTVNGSWATSTAYTANKVIVPSSTKENGHIYTSQTAGTSMSSEPTWSITANATIYDTAGISNWIASTTYALNDLVVPTTQVGFYYKCTTAGTSSGTQPTWPTTAGQTVSDNVGYVTWVANTNYGLNAIVIPTTANGYFYKCTTAGMSSMTQPTWPTTTGNIVTDNAGNSSWAASTAYTINTMVVPTTQNGYVYMCTTAGTSGATQPTWPTTAGSTVTDGTSVWTCYAEAVWTCFSIPIWTTVQAVIWKESGSPWQAWDTIWTQSTDGTSSGLDADMVDGLHAATTSTVSTVAARDASGNLTAKQFVSDVATGTAPLIVTSSTKVPNLNVDMVDGIKFSSGTDASKPSATGSGNIYFATDTTQIYRDSASGTWTIMTNVVTANNRNTVTLASAGNSVTIGITGYSWQRDVLLVYANGTYIEKGESTNGYNISGDSLTITKITGNWNAGTAFNFIVLGTAQGNSPAFNIALFTNSYTASASVTHIPIGIANYNNVTDVLEVYHNNVLLYPTDNYTINSDGISIDLTYSINSGDKVYFRVLKNVRTDITDPINNLIVAELTNTYTASSNGITNIPIGIIQYTPSTDILHVYYKNLRMIQDTNYSLNANGTSIDLSGWSLSNGDVIYFTVMKNVRSSISASIDGGIIGNNTIVGSNKIYSKSITANEINDYALAYGQYRNFIINGGFDIWQNGTSFSNPTNKVTSYCADMWSFNRATFAAGITATRQTSGLTESLYNIRIQRTSGDTNMSFLGLAYTFESSESIKFLGKTVTLSIKCRVGSDYAGTAQFKLYSGTGTNESVVNGFTSANNFANAIFTPNSNWATYSFTFNVPTGINQLGFNILYTPTNATAGANDYIEVCQVVWNIGDKVLPYCPKSFNDELMTCQRYYEKSYPYAIAPGAVNNSGCYSFNAYGSAYNNNGQVSFKVSKRTTPSINVYSTNSGAIGQYFDWNAGVDKAGSYEAQGETGFCTSTASGALTQPNIHRFHWTADARL